MRRVSVETEAADLAATFRARHRLGGQPLGDLIAVIEQATGVDVAVLDAGPDEHGLTMRDPHRDVVIIGVARTRHPMRQRSSLAHELGHVLFEDWERGEKDLSVRRPEEMRADAFARHLLVPTAGLRDFFGDKAGSDLSALSSVVQRFLVSPPVAAIAMHAAGYISVETKKDWLALTTPRVAARFGWSDHYRALQADSDQRRAPQRLLERAISGYIDGVVSAQAIATLRGVRLEYVEAELGAAGIVPELARVEWTTADDLPEVDVDLSDLDVEPTDDGHGARPDSAQGGR